MTEWLQGCEICNGGLCARMDELRAQGRTTREAAKICETEAAECIGYPLWTAAQIRRRYQNHKGQQNGPFCATQSQTFQPLEGVVFDLQDLINEEKVFGTIYADPPWPYQNQATRSSTSGVYKPGEWQLSLEDLCNLPIPQLTTEKAHLHLWTTNAFLFDAKTVLEAWGFEYKSVFVWVKPQLGIGNYWRLSHEFLLLGVKGGQRFRDMSQRSWQELPRGKHSQKPEEIAEIICKVSPGPFLELFARRGRIGWVVWGNEIKRTLFDGQH